MSLSSYGRPVRSVEVLMDQKFKAQHTFKEKKSIIKRESALIFNDAKTENKIFSVDRMLFKVNDIICSREQYCCAEKVVRNIAQRYSNRKDVWLDKVKRETDF